MPGYGGGVGGDNAPGNEAGAGGGSGMGGGYGGAGGDNALGRGVDPIEALAREIATDIARRNGINDPALVEQMTRDMVANGTSPSNMEYIGNNTLSGYVNDALTPGAVTPNPGSSSAITGPNYQWSPPRAGIGGFLGSLFGGPIGAVGGGLLGGNWDQVSDWFGGGTGSGGGEGGDFQHQGPGSGLALDGGNENQIPADRPPPPGGVTAPPVPAPAPAPGTGPYPQNYGGVLDAASDWMNNQLATGGLTPDQIAGHENLRGYADYIEGQFPGVMGAYNQFGQANPYAPIMGQSHDNNMRVAGGYGTVGRTSAGNFRGIGSDAASDYGNMLTDSGNRYSGFLDQARDPSRNPYLSAAAMNSAGLTGRALRENILPALDNAAAGAGQVGSSRHALMTGLAGRGAAEAISRDITGMYSDAYDTGQTNFLTGLGNMDRTRLGGLQGAYGMRLGAETGATGAEFTGLRGQLDAYGNIDRTLLTGQGNQDNRMLSYFGGLPGMYGMGAIPGTVRTGIGSDVQQAPWRPIQTAGNIYGQEQGTSPAPIPGADPITQAIGAGLTFWGMGRPSPYQNNQDDRYNWWD